MFSDRRQNWTLDAEQMNKNRTEQGLLRSAEGVRRAEPSVKNNDDAAVGRAADSAARAELDGGWR